jgi:DNA-directed RNA polymerase subunit L
MASTVTVENIHIEDLRPRLKSPVYEKYLPKTLFPERITFDIYPVSNAVANGIRRTADSELLVNALYMDFHDLTTNDVFIIPEMVIARLRMIPLAQSCPIDAVFELTASNETADVRDVKSGEIRIIRPGSKPIKSLPFNETFTLFTLRPGKSIRMSNMGIHQSYAYIPGDGMHAVAVNTRSVALDQTPINIYEKLGGKASPSEDIVNVLASAPIYSSMSNPRKWQLSFTTNGTHHPKKIMVDTCNNIAARLSSVKSLLYTMHSNNDEYLLVIPNESYTIGNLLMRTVLDLYPDIIFVSFNVGSTERVCSIRIKCNEDINTIYNSTIDHLIELFGEIKTYFA